MADSGKKEQKPKGEKGGKKKGKEAADATVDASLPDPPAYLKKRVEIFERAKARYAGQLAAKEHKAIHVTLPDGKVLDGVAWETTPMDVAKKISAGLAKAVVVSKVDEKIWDLMRPLESDCTLKLFKFDSEEGKHAFWHSSAHVLGQALELLYGGKLGVGPALESGFYYDIGLSERQVSSDEFPKINAVAQAIAKEGQPFERIAVTKSEALEMFGYNQYKCDLISNDIPDGSDITVYRCGPLIDLCRGPHLPNTGLIKAFKVTKNSSAYWKSKAENDTLQRLYGVSFPSKDLMEEYEHFVEEAEKRDHRKIGQEQELFFFHPLSPGSAFFLPHGTRIYNRLVTMIRDIYWRRGYSEVVSPNVYNHKLWETSGHWQNYKENMFTFECEHDLYALKPMNCPGHCLMFKSGAYSYRDLPLRMADFGVLHRNELSGTLTGLTRVRRFQQDDSHIFCTFDQVQTEVAGVLDMLREVYGIFGFTFELNLSTRPEKYLGEIDTWDEAEKALAEALDTFGEPWGINEKDGAFYGPKIDITISDALRRKHQCATCQLDFQLPERFGLEYMAAEGGERKRPVMIHRAILGSVERMIAILCENYAGKWPFWLSPRQAVIVPVGVDFYDYCQSVHKRLHDAGFHVDVDLSSKTMNDKIRLAAASQANYILILGASEQSKNCVNVRLRGELKPRGEISVDDLIAEFRQNVAEWK